MTTSHTPGRLQLDDAQPGDIRRYLISDIGDIPYFMASVPLDGQVTDAKAEANARRLAACWNALLPFTTKHIEQGIDIAALVTQRDELLEALHRLLCNPDDRNKEFARAAINKTGGVK